MSHDIFIEAGVAGGRIAHQLALKNNTSNYVRNYVQETGVGTLLDDSQFVTYHGVHNPRAGRVVGAGGDGAVTMVTWVGGAPYGCKTTASKEENELQVHYLLSSRTGTVDFFFNPAKSSKTRHNAHLIAVQTKLQHNNSLRQQHSAWERVCHRWSTDFSCTKKSVF